MAAATTVVSDASFSCARRLSIADLSPYLSLPSSLFVEIDVVLVWPYSSSTRTFSLLLANSDTRRRKDNGHVKVTFHGLSAQIVAQSRVGIGDRVNLGLDGVEWVATGGKVQTPGKRIQWDLIFEHRVLLEVRLLESDTMQRIADEHLGLAWREST